MTASKAASLLVAYLVCFPATIAAAQPTVPNAQRDAENKQINAAVRRGPADIALRDQAVLHLPAGEIYVPPKEAAILMQRMGNITGENFMGLVFPGSDDQHWFVDVGFDDSGYIKDDDEKSIDADALLQNLKDATETDNEIRRQKGQNALQIGGWIERPHYDKASHHLVWSIELHQIDDKGATLGGNINYNTYALGRGGYITLDLVTQKDAVEKDKTYVAGLLSNLIFKQGKRYEDFDIKTDKVAEYGLLGLIGVVAVKKLGLLAIAAAFLVKGAKIIFLACVAGLAAARRFFKRDKKSPEPAPELPPTSG